MNRDFAVSEPRPEPIGVIEAVKVDFRLGMVVGRIRGPFPWEIAWLWKPDANDHIYQG